MEGAVLLAIIGIGLCLIKINLFYGQWQSRQRALTREKVFELQRQGIEAELCTDCCGEGSMGIFHSECPQCGGLGFWLATDEQDDSEAQSPAEAETEQEQLSVPV